MPAGYTPLSTGRVTRTRDSSTGAGLGGHLEKAEVCQNGVIDGHATRRKFSKAFKREAVQLFRNSGKTKNQVARELGVRCNVLTGWIEMVAAEEKTGLSPEELEELKRLRRENARLQMEVEILGKATAFFASRNRLGSPSSERRRPNFPSLPSVRHFE
jgi:transposase